MVERTPCAKVSAINEKQHLVAPEMLLCKHGVFTPVPYQL
eukprot:XP_001708802.1 Hypothetical protein GL50803_9250 [Giardia lamblia ATCC 50803]